MMNSFERILVLAPHTDDGEFGCGATIARLVAEGKNVRYVAFSAAEDSLPADWPKDTLRKEVVSATRILGLKDSDLDVLDFKVRFFPEQRQEILEYMIRLQREYKPDAVFLPSSNDTHQDHHVIALEGFRAFKKTTMLGYEVPWNNLTFNTQAFVFIGEIFARKKVNALKCYKSQADRPYANEEFLRSLMRTRGTQIGATYAEAFEVVRWIAK